MEDFFSYFDKAFPSQDKPKFFSIRQLTSIAYASEANESSIFLMTKQLSDYKQIKVQNLHHYEFKFNKKESNIVLQINDITRLINLQEALSKRIYTEALIANISHNQNTSLNSLLANSKLLVKWHKNKAIDIEAEGYMDHIEMTVDHMKYSNEC